MEDKSHCAHGPTNKVLWCSFFMLGMGLMAPYSAVMQTMDYLNEVYAEFNPSRILTVLYVALNVATLFTLFFFGNLVWPNKKSRMLAGYIIYTAMMVLLPIIDVIVDKAGQAMHPHTALIIGYSIWAVCSALLGASDALICTVAYGESAAISPRYTHAFLAGEATSGLVLAAIRVVSKAAMSDDLAGLRASTSIFLSIAAVIVLGCVLVVAVVLPRQREAIEALKARPGLSIQATLQVLEVVKHSESLRRLPTLQQLPHKLQRSSTLRAMGSLVAPKYSLFEVLSAAAAEASAPGQLEGLGFGSGKQQALVRIHSTAAGKATSAPLVKIDEDGARDQSNMVGKHSRANWLLQVGSRELSRISSSTADTDADAGVAIVPLQSSGPAAAAAPSWRKASGQQQLQLQSERSVGSAADTSYDAEEGPMWSPFSERSAENLKHSPPASPRAATAPQAAAVAAKQHVWQPRSRFSLERFAAGGLVREGLSTTSSAWLAVRLIYPYLIAVAAVYFVASFVFPMCLSPQVGEWPAVGSWYTQIILLAYAVGTLLGNTIPIWHPKYPRITVLTASCLVAVFIPAFVLAIMFKAGPAAIITFTFVLLVCSSYIAAMVFCLAPHGLLSSDCEVVEILVVLALTLGDILGLFLSWLWTIPGAFDTPAR